MPRDVALQGNGAKSLAGTSEVLALANPSRIQITICNTGAADMWLAYDEAALTPGGATQKPAAVAATGIRLNAGQTMVETNYRGEIRIIGTAAQVCTYVEL